MDSVSIRHTFSDVSQLTAASQISFESPNGELLGPEFWKALAGENSVAGITQLLLRHFGDSMRNESNIQDLALAIKAALDTPAAKSAKGQVLRLSDPIWQRILSPTDVFLGTAESIANDVSVATGSVEPRAMGALAIPSGDQVSPRQPRETLLAKIAADPAAYTRLSKSQRAEPELALAALQTKDAYNVLSSVPKALFNNSTFLATLATTVGVGVSELAQSSDQLALLLAVLGAYPEAWSSLSPDLQAEPELAKLHLRQYPAAFHDLPPDMQQRPDVIGEAHALGITDPEMAYDLDPAAAGVFGGGARSRPTARRARRRRPISASVMALPA